MHCCDWWRLIENLDLFMIIEILDTYCTLISIAEMPTVRRKKTTLRASVTSNVTEAAAKQVSESTFLRQSANDYSIY